MKTTKRDDRHAVKFLRGLSWLGILLLGLLLWGGPVSADPAGNAGAPVSEEGVVVEPLPVAEMTIAKKTEKRVISNMGDSYALSQGTIIVGQDGRQVRLEKMPVPCEAKVTYKIMQGVRYAFRIQILWVGSDATSELILEVPR
jgi:hypothetical protein